MDSCIVPTAALFSRERERHGLFLLLRLFLAVLLPTCRMSSLPLRLAQKRTILLGPRPPLAGSAGVVE